MNLKLILIPLLVLFGLTTANAAAAPVTKMEKLTNQLLTDLDKEKINMQNNPNRVYNIIDRVILPHVDRVGMSRSALGREAWTSASSEQREEFVDVFTDLVKRTYASALASYDNEKVTYLPIRGDISGKKRVQVESTVVRENGQTIPVSYRLALKKGEWMIYDMSVEGVSLLRNFRTQFSAELTNGTLAELITKLQKHNLANN